MSIAASLLSARKRPIFNYQSTALLSHMGVRIEAALYSTFQYAIFQKQTLLIPAENIYGWYLKLSAQILIPIQAALLAFAIRNRFRR